MSADHSVRLCPGFCPGLLNSASLTGGTVIGQGVGLEGDAPPSGQGVRGVSASPGAGQVGALSQRTCAVRGGAQRRNSERASGHTSSVCHSPSDSTLFQTPPAWVLEVASDLSSPFYPHGPPFSTQHPEPSLDLSLIWALGWKPSTVLPLCFDGSPNSLPRPTRSPVAWPRPDLHSNLHRLPQWPSRDSDFPASAQLWLFLQNLFSSCPCMRAGGVRL